SFLSFGVAGKEAEGQGGAARGRLGAGGRDAVDAQVELAHVLRRRAAARRDPDGFGRIGDRGRIGHVVAAQVGVGILAVLPAGVVGGAVVAARTATVGGAARVAVVVAGRKAARGQRGGDGEDERDAKKGAHQNRARASRWPTTYKTVPATTAAPPMPRN